ncbi:hypothetical protein ACQYAD_12870 [Neobacillus sp. SM06]|uniref:hypothetical protein n=1 Tax=Neobacillus sp. SM06 TaxID=3422492 RepID=UPI003D2668B1
MTIYMSIVMMSWNGKPISDGISVSILLGVIIGLLYHIAETLNDILNKENDVKEYDSIRKREAEK